MLFFTLQHHVLRLLRDRPLYGGAVAQSVERATPGEEVPDSIPAEAARSRWVGVSIMLSPSSVSCVAALKIVRRSWGPSAI